MSPPEVEPGQWYTGDPSRRQPDGWRRLPVLRTDELSAPSGYITDPGAVAAVQVALTLGHPLLLTGDPGCGKTLLASAVAHELGFDPPLKFETKSTTESRDLFYLFDAVGRLHASQSAGEGSAPVNFITYNALGLAIIYANDRQTVASALPARFEHPGQRRSVVLIDEIDKAPRDVPNDILNEIDAMFFRIPELGNLRVAASPAMRPIVFITSNSEKGLPDAFLRRCVYYHMPFPTDRLTRIVESRIGRRFSDGLLAEMLAFFHDARSPQRALRKPPGVAELLLWLSAVRDLKAPGSLRESEPLLNAARTTLFKTREDLKTAEEMIRALTGAGTAR